MHRHTFQPLRAEFVPEAMRCMKGFFDSFLYGRGCGMIFFLLKVRMIAMLIRQLRTIR
ncbi:MAG: hypothetical protein H7240_01095 [Glaciimonas sp.]|nr:hypothetical protein [Glaciimonas sp.]